MSILEQQQLIDEIELLPLELKTQILDKLLNSLNSIDKNVDDAWLKEIQKRKDEIESNKVNLISGEKVFEKISQRFKI